MKNIIIIIVLMLVGCGVDKTPVQAPIRQVDSRVVIVRSISGSGAGLLMGDKVITCEHVIRSGVLTVEYTDGQIGIATLIKSSKEHDLALLSVTNSHGSQPIKFGFMPRPATPCHAIGHPVAGDYSYTQGEVSFPSIRRESSYRTLCRMKIDYGYSGCPCFTYKDEFIGIVSAMYRGTDYSLIIPAHVVWTFMNSP